MTYYTHTLYTIYYFRLYTIYFQKENIQRYKRTLDIMILLILGGKKIRAKKVVEC